MDLGFATFEGRRRRVAVRIKFWGVRCAAPPLGKLRFRQAPADHLWSLEVFSELTHWVLCVCYGVGRPPSRPLAGASEDRLFLDVWALSDVTCSLKELGGY